MCVTLTYYYYILFTAIIKTRDQYGFIKGSQWISVEEQVNFEKIYQPVVNRRQQKWRRLIAENNGEWPQPSSKCKYIYTHLFLSFFFIFLLFFV